MVQFPGSVPFTSCQVLVKGCAQSTGQLPGFSLPLKSVIRITDPPNMTAVYLGRQAKNQTKTLMAKIVSSPRSVQAYTPNLLL